MLDKTTLIETLLRRLKKLEIGDYLDLRSYKRDRSILFIRESETQFHLIENGFEQVEFHLDLDGVKKLMKTLLKREFPRSHKLRLYEMGAYDAFSAGKVERGKI